MTEFNGQTEKQMKKQMLKSLFSGYYDLQKLRIQMGNRIVANFKIRMGQQTSTPEKDMEKEDMAILVRVRKAYKTMAEAATDLPRIGKFHGNEVIAEYSELALVHAYEKMLLQEAEMVKPINQVIHKERLWKDYLKGVSGVGELMALVIIALIDIEKAKYPSSLWKYSGLDVAPDNRARSMRGEHLEEREYTNKDGELKTKMGITYNPILKAKLLGVLGPSFIKAGIRKNEESQIAYATTKWAQMYLDYKNRLESHPVYKDGGTAPTRSKNGKNLPSPKKHRHDMAIRYIVKMFLIDLHVAWREIEGLPVSKPYHEAKLGMKHGEAA